LTSTWLTAIGTVLSAIWILVANAWMQHPVGMEFNIETARNEMIDFWAIAFSEVAVTKFIHTVASGFMTAAVFVAGISAWFLIKKREQSFALNSFKIAAVFGLLSSLILLWTGDTSGVYVAKYQPAKFAAFEGLYKGSTNANLTVLGVLNPKKELDNQESEFLAKIDIPSMLSFLAFHDIKAFVPGFNDLVYGNKEQGIMGADEKIVRGRIAIEKLRLYHAAVKSGNEQEKSELKHLFDSSTEEGKIFLKENFAYFGYAYLNSPKDIIPNIPMTFYSFRIMVFLGFYFILLFILAIWFQYKKTLATHRLFLYTMLLSIPLVYIASQAGWVVAEVGRQPWTIQDLLPTIASLSSIDSTSVAVTFFLFASLFAVMLVAELSIMFKQIKIGPQDE
ncbi:MAG: cytochrome ubiquinol oxidase subunit I, partial [Bacteroidales bacterium]